MPVILVHIIHFRWVPIKGNDWYWIRQHIKVGMQVIVEILVSNVDNMCAPYG